MKSILLIDDEAVDCLIFSKLIEKSKFAEKVVTFNFPLQALGYLNNLLETKVEWPTHIFVDINMPQINGFEFIEEYLKIPGVTEHGTKIFIISSSTNPEDKSRARGYQCISEYVNKPITIEKAKVLLEA